MNAVSQLSQDCAEVAEARDLLQCTIYTMGTDCRAIFANTGRLLLTRMSDQREKAHEYRHVVVCMANASATPQAVIAAAVAINPGRFQFGIG
jgi:hypothetical protein